LATSGVQDGSAVVAGLPSVSANWMAVLGRQKGMSYLPRQQAMAASAAVMLRIASIRALSVMSSR
jgi:hypothetical protein